jgi:2-keto-4-pentenoate hydratase
MDRLGTFADAFLGLFRGHDDEGRHGTPIVSLSLDDAYEVQRRVIEARTAGGEQVVGYKVGCTSRAIRQQFGLTEPVCGQLMSPHIHRGDTTLDWHAYHRPAVEPEFVFVMGKDLTDEVGEIEPLIDAIDSVSPGIEVHHYRFRYGEPTSQELVASNGLHACLVVGDRKIRPRDFDMDLEGVGLFVNGVLADSGIGAEVMGGPLISLRWLVNHLVRRGEILRAGQLVIPGSPVGLIPVGPGDRVAARFTHLGGVEAMFRGGDAGETDCHQDGPPGRLTPSPQAEIQSNPASASRSSISRST